MAKRVAYKLRVSWALAEKHNLQLLYGFSLEFLDESLGWPVRDTRISRFSGWRVFCVFNTHCDIQTGNLPAIIMNIAISLARTIHEMASISRRDLFSQCLVFKYQVFLRPLLL